MLESRFVVRKTAGVRPRLGSARPPLRHDQEPHVPKPPEPHVPKPPEPPEVGRRTVLRAAATGAVALPLVSGCGLSLANGRKVKPQRPGEVLLRASEVPVGGGTILPDKQVVVTQPAKGTIKAFSAVCTHAGCIVSQVQQRTIVCPCHHSQFSIRDGSVVAGPAPAPLPRVRVTVRHGKVVTA
jgi:nitrite reductase/ring-hydroxylating ferredoxin subunit